MRDWNLDEARDLMGILEPIGQRHGYLLAVYGSTMQKGRGRDLDLLAVPWRESYSPDGLVSEILWTVRGREPLPREQGLFGQTSVTIALPDNRIIDLQLRDAKVLTRTPYLHFRGRFDPL